MPLWLLMAIMWVTTSVMVIFHPTADHIVPWLAFGGIVLGVFIAQMVQRARPKSN